MRNALYLISAFVLFGCGHHRDVRPGAGGQNTVTVLNESEEEGQRDALAQAAHYCDQSDQRPEIQDENTQYVGEMDEAQYKTMKTASKVAETVGGAIFMDQSQNANRNSGVAYTGARVLDDVSGKGYRTTIRFRCR